MALDQLIQEVLALLRANPQLALLLGLALLGGIGRLLGGNPQRRPERRGTRGGGGRPAEPGEHGRSDTVEDDAAARARELEERIRRNFEEMLRRRGGAAEGTAAGPAPAAPRTPAVAPAATPVAQGRSRMTATAEPTHAPTRRNYEEGIARRSEARSLETARPARKRAAREPLRAKTARRNAAAAKTVARAGGTAPAAGQRPRHLDRGRGLLPDLDRAGLRRAFVMREVLGPPRALQELDEAAR